MTKKSTLTERLWHGSLLLLGSIIALNLAIHFLSYIWGWLIAAGVVVALILLVRFWLHRRRDSW